MSTLAGHMAMLSLGSGGGTGDGPLLHFDGSNGSTSIVDAHGLSTWTAFGSAQLSTAEAKFGLSSLAVNGGYVSTPDTGVGALIGEFCIEGFLYATSGSPRGVFQLDPNSSANNLALGRNGNFWEVYHSGSGTGATNTALPSGWFHFAVFRVGSTVALAIDGVVILTFTDSSNLGNIASLTFGIYFNTAFPWIGYMDECRVTNGTSPYSAGGFTPPSAPFT